MKVVSGDPRLAFPYALSTWYRFPSGDFGCLAFADTTTLVFVAANFADLRFVFVGRAAAPFLFAVKREEVIEALGRSSVSLVDLAERKKLWDPNA